MQPYTYEAEHRDRSAPPPPREDPTDAPVIQAHDPPILDLLLPRVDGLLEVRPLDAQPLDVAGASLDLLLDVVDLSVHLLQLVVEGLHLHDLLIELCVRSGDRQARVRVSLAQAGEGEAGVEDLAGERGSFEGEGAGFGVVCGAASGKSG